MKSEKWIVGAEHDELLLKRLAAALKAVGFTLKEKWQGVAGSQEVMHWEATSERGSLIIEAETYMGLKVEGPPELVQQVRQQFEASKENGA